MLSSFILYLRPLRPLVVDRHVGRWINGLIYALVQTRSPTLATYIHEEMNPKPFTVSTLMGTLEWQNGQPCAIPSEVYAVRCTVLSEALFAVLGEVVVDLYLSGGAMRLGGGYFELVRLGVAPYEQDPWVATTTYSALLNADTSLHDMLLIFASPTAFKLGKQHLLFPQPYNVFGSLYRSWVALAEPELSSLPEDLMTFVDKNVIVSRYELRSEKIAAGQYSLIGFKGECHYHLLSRERLYVNALATLARFALYNGVGMKTTQGMGQVRWEE